MSALRALAAPAGESVLVDALAAWVPQQRWYAGKARAEPTWHVHDLALIHAPQGPLLLLEVQATYPVGDAVRYFVPVAIATEPPKGSAVIAHFPEGALVDAMSLAWACVALARLAAARTTHPTVNGAMIVGTAEPDADLGLFDGDGEVAVRPLGNEQSNSSAVLGERIAVKLFRRISAGIHPDLELPRALAREGVEVSPALLGSLSVHEDQPSLLLTLSTLIADARDGWDLATSEVAPLASDLTGHAADQGLAAHVEHLGSTVGTMHAALARQLGRHPVDRHVTTLWAARMDTDAVEVLSLAASQAPTQTRAVLTRRNELRAALSGLAQIDQAGFRIRVHGDLHLGQVLFSKAGWRILDFEGEPERPLSERRLPRSPLKDVAGMLRSFDYAASHGHSSSAAQPWQRLLRERFLNGYLNRVGPTGLLPADPTTVTRLRDIFELDKAIYELGYELANRPDWVGIPAQGIVRILDHLRTGEVA